MSKMKLRNRGSYSLLFALFLRFATLTHAQSANPDVPDPGNSTSPDQAACTLRWLDELITCRGINHTQLIKALGDIRQQIHEKKQVTIARDLESGDKFAVQEENADKAINSSSNHQGLHRQAEIRELNIISCDIPKLTSSNLNTPSSLEILSIVSSGVREIHPDTFSDHGESLTRLALTHNRLDSLPVAVNNLTRLEVLDLRHNEIDHLPNSSLFFNLHRLRQLHLDHNRLGQIAEIQAKLNLGSPGLSLKVFNLEPLWESLTHLTLANNNIKVFPEQFSRPFNRLTSLDLSSNGFSDILSDGFQKMPNLQYLDLSENLLTGFSPEFISFSLLELNLKGNPWNCDCDSSWVLEKLKNATAESGVIVPPTCASPLHLQNHELNSLKEEDICPSDKNLKTTKVIFVGDNTDGSLNRALDALHLLNVTVLNHQALIVSWRIDGEFYSSQDEVSKPISWAITLHKTKDNPRQVKITRMKLERYKKERPDWRPSETLYTELLHGLDTNVQYTLCLVPVQDNYLFTRPDQCQTASTMEELSHSPPQITQPITTTTKTPKTTTESPRVDLILTEDYKVKTEEVVMVNEARKILLSWNVTIELHSDLNNHVKREAIILQPLGWKITYRKFAEENDTEIVLVSRGGEPVQNFTNHYTVDELSPGTGYTFCFRPLTDTEVQDSLKGSNGDAYEITSNLPAFALPRSRSRGKSQNAEYGPTRNTIEEDNISNLGANDVDSQINPSDTLYPDYDFSNIPSNIPPIPTISPQRIPSNLEPNDVASPANPSDPLHSDYDLSNIPSNIPPIPTIRPQRIPSNIPPLPNFPNSPSSFGNRPPRPTQQSPGNNFVYTSTGERIPLPSSVNGPTSPFNVPSIVGPRLSFNPSPSQWSSPDHPILNIPRNPQQRFTYDVDDRSAETSDKQVYTYDFTTESDTSTTEKPQRFTYETRRRKKRSVDRNSKVIYEKRLDSGSIEFCREMVTLAEDSILAPVAIASTVSTSTTVIIVILFCCCCPRKCRKKKSSWHGKVPPETRKISTISNPTPANGYTRQSSSVSGTTVGDDGNSDFKSLPSQISMNEPDVIDGNGNNHQIKTGRSVSVTSSTGYLTPIPTSNGTTPDSDHVFNEAKMYLPSQRAYLNSVKDRLLQQHKDLKDFHPGYDIPPTSSIKSLLGYDYPHPTPVNPIGTHTDEASKQAISNKEPIPSPSSSDSNYNASVSDPKEVELRPEVNLNIPFNLHKISNSNKKFNINKGQDLYKSNDYNYINPEETRIKPRTYTKNAPSKTKRRKFGSPQRLPEEHHQESVKQLHGIMSMQSPSHLSRSVPDLATAGKKPDTSEHNLKQPTDINAAARLNLLIENQRKVEERTMSSLPTIQPEGRKSPKHMKSINDYENISSGKNSTLDPKISKDKDHYHTWSSSRPNAPRSRPSLGEVVLTGGTLIEVPEGYVIPKPPKPTRSVRLLVPGEDKPITLDKKEIIPDINSVGYTPPPPTPTSPKEIKSLTPTHSSLYRNEKSQITHLITPELDNNVIVISTGMAV